MTNSRIWFYSIVAALGGFLFGFDTIVINGAEKDIQAVWNLSGSMHGWVISSALWGTVIGSLLGGRVSDRFGRKRTLFSVGILFFVSAVWSGLASGPWTMIAALITLVFPLAAEKVPAWTIFAFFGVMMVFHFLWALLVVPETKGKELT